MPWAWMSLACSVAAVAAAMPPRAIRHPVAARSLPSPTGRISDDGPLRALRWVWALGAAVLVVVAVPPPAGAAVAATAAGATWWLIGRSETRQQRRERWQATRELPQVVALLAAALRSGADPGSALRLVAHALPGPASDRLGGALSRLQLGADPGAVWDHLATDDILAPLGRALGRAHRSGISVTAQIGDLAEQLAGDQRARAEERARGVGVRAAVPLGLCLLPAFVLLGIVPIVASLLSGVLRGN